MSFLTSFLASPVVGHLSDGLGLLNSVTGSMSQVNASKQAALYSASVANANASISDQKAAQVKEQGAYLAGQKMKEGRDFVGKQRAALSSSGIKVDSGSTQDVLNDTTATASLDTAVIRYNSDLQAWGYNVEAMNYRAKAQASSTEASQYNPGLSLATTLLNGASKLQEKYASQTKKA